MDIGLLKTTIGRKLKQARKEQDLTQDDVAAKLDITAVAYGSFERGTNLIGLNYLIEVSRILQKPITFFFPSPYVTSQELNDLSHDPLVQRLLANFQALATDHAKRTVVSILELMVKKQAERGDGMTKT